MIRLPPNGFEKVQAETGPVVVAGYAKETVEVEAAPCGELDAQAEDRDPYEAVLPHEVGNEHPAHRPVAVHKWVYRLELGVLNRNLHKAITHVRVQV